MDEIALQLEHSVEAEVSTAFAWTFRIDVANWNDPPAKFVHEENCSGDGGSRGVRKKYRLTSRMRSWVGVRISSIVGRALKAWIPATAADR